MKRIASVVALSGALVLTACGSAEEPDRQPAAPTSSTSSGDALRAKLDARREQATEECEDSVKDRLKAPATAQFSEVETTPSGAESYDVAGAVDSENSFGALIRSHFTCKATLLDNGEWESSAAVY
jgi:hypothetical protein